MARILQITDDEYFADINGPSLSQSIAKKIIQESPRHAWAAHPRLGKRPDQEDKRTKAMTKGQIFHKLLLGAGAEIVVLPFDDFRKGAAQAARDEAIAANKLPVLEAKHEEAAEAVNAATDQIRAYGIKLSPMSEVKLEWHEQLGDGPVLCKAMLDNVYLEHGAIIDIKSTESAKPMKMERSMIEYGYHIQDAAYRSAISALNPELRGRAEMSFLFCELEYPYVVTLGQCDGMMRELGEAQWERAVRIWQRCLSSGVWPAYSSGCVPLTPPPWVLTQELGNAAH